MLCNECKKKITENNIFFYDCANEIGFCSKTCLKSYIIKEKEKEDRNFLISTLQRIFNRKVLPPRIFAEIKRFHEKEGLSYRRIAAICHYLYDYMQENINYLSIYKVIEVKDAAEEWYKEKSNKQEVIKDNKQRVTMPNYTQRKKVLSKINPDDV